MASSTTANGSKKKDRSACYHCGSSDHRAKRCPQESKCRVCNAEGHNAAACPRHDRPIDLGFFRLKPNKFRYIELFAGVGGFRVALDRLGGSCLFASEVDRFARRNYELNHSDRPAGDITKISEEDIPDHDLLVGGFPCQAFSSAGERKGFEDPRGILFLEIVRILKHKQPKAILLENVRGLVTHEEGKTFATILSELEGVGYNVQWKVLDAVKVVPQERKRVYIVGNRKDIGCGPHRYEYEFPAIPTLNRGFIDIMEGEMDRATIEKLSLTETQIQKVKNQSYTQKFPGARFLSDVKAPTKTLQSSYASYIVNSQFVPCPCHETTTTWRRLSPREAARLQGFPESFQLCPERPYHLLGNAVVPSMIALIAAPLLPFLDVALSDPIAFGQKVAMELLLQACPGDERAASLRARMLEVTKNWK